MIKICTQIKHVFLFTVIIAFAFFTSGCATIYLKQDGTVVSVKKIRNRDYRPHGATVTGSKIGGTAGVAMGAPVGAVIGLALGGLASAGTAELIGLGLAGAAVGGLAVGAVGAAAGGGLGYVVDSGQPYAGMYQFKVKPDGGGTVITVEQYATPIPVHTKVHILEKNDIMYIEKI